MVEPDEYEEAHGSHRVVTIRIDELLIRYSGCIDSGGSLRERVEGLRREWRPAASGLDAGLPMNDPSA